MPTTVVSARIDENIKRKADRIIKSNGSTTNEVLKAVWENIAETGQLPAQTNLPKNQSKEEVFNAFLAFLEQAPEPNEEYVNFSDDEILARRVYDHA